MIDGQNGFDQSVKNNMRTYDNIRKIAYGEGQDNTTVCLLNYFKYHYKMIAIYLSKKQRLDADPKAIQHINFTGDLNWRGDATMFFIIEEAKETILDFSQWTVKVLLFYFVLI